MGEHDPNKARETVVNAIEQTFAHYGLPRSCGRLYGVLYFADEPLSLDDLAERGSYAKSTVSDSMGVLRDLYLVYQVRPPDGQSRRSYYEAERDLWGALYQAARDTGRREVRTMNRALEDARQSLEAADDPGTDLERVRSLQAEYEYVEAMVDLLESVPPEQFRELIVQLSQQGVVDDMAVGAETKGQKQQDQSDSGD